MLSGRDVSLGPHRTAGQRGFSLGSSELVPLAAQRVLRPKSSGLIETFGAGDLVPFFVWDGSVPIG